MLARTRAALIALTLSACTSHEGPVSTIYTPDRPPAELTIAVASVQLIQDCSDPPEPVAAKPVAEAEPAGPIIHPVGGSKDYPLVEHPGSVDPAFKGPGFNQPCTQSTVQLSLSNKGVVSGRLQILNIRLLDAATQRELGTLVGRKPSLWSEAGTYQPWDEIVSEGGAGLKVAYRLGDPDWTQVQARLDPGSSLFTRPFMLEIEFKFDGATQTVRSPEFVRQEVFMVVT